MRSNLRSFQLIAMSWVSEFLDERYLYSLAGAAIEVAEGCYAYEEDSEARFAAFPTREECLLRCSVTKYFILSLYQKYKYQNTRNCIVYVVYYGTSHVAELHRQLHFVDVAVSHKRNYAS